LKQITAVHEPPKQRRMTMIVKSKNPETMVLCRSSKSPLRLRKTKIEAHHTLGHSSIDALSLRHCINYDCAPNFFREASRA
ncbi:MAG TPA: hypothetical protein VLL05_09885, partial [Terriglobales bacterium]|nr:hypothetical protein [Terriglobales bacterium]